MRTKPIKTPPNWRDLKPHPLSELTDFGAGLDMEAMERFILDHGYDPDERIVLHDGMILNGRHTFVVLKGLNTTPRFSVFCGKNAMAYVAKKISGNI